MSTRRQPRNTQLTCPACGYATKVTTAGIATKALERHSCAHTRELARRAAAAQARRTAVGEVRDCEHPESRHEHGTRIAYIRDRCRCRACRDANAAAQAHRDRLVAYGQWEPLVDADPVRAHVRALQATGMGWQRIARTAGISTGAMSKLLYGKKLEDGTRRPPSRRVARATAERILAVHASVDLLADKALIDGTGTRRRLRALVAHGWSMNLIGQRLGMASNNFGRLVKADHDLVFVSTYRAVKALYDELWDQAPRADDQRSRISVSRSKRYAHDHGWLPALAWDDSTIDDPAAWADLGDDNPAEDFPDDVMVQRLVDAYPDSVWVEYGATRADRIAAAERLDLQWRLATSHLSMRDKAARDHDAPTRSRIDKALSLRAERDYAPQATTQVA